MVTYARNLVKQAAEHVKAETQRSARNATSTMLLNLMEHVFHAYLDVLASAMLQMLPHALAALMDFISKTMFVSIARKVVPPATPTNAPHAIRITNYLKMKMVSFIASLDANIHAKRVILKP